ncbi:hypothetical protein [Streptomyces sp. NBC_00035]|uniref:hypothetical protein n=1 Tax=Streptomyces sp. NBC_00035 TaxID=2903614 RepID=UPI003246E109
MTIEIWVAIISGAVALTSATVGTYSAVLSARIQREMEVRRHRVRKEEEIENVMSRFREPFLRAAFELQTRIHNIANSDFVSRVSGDGTHAEPGYVRSSTLFRLAQYFGWVEILRKSVQFLDLGDQERTRQLSDKLDRIGLAFAETSAYPENAAFRLYRDEQRALGELMIERTPGAARELQCMNYVQFVEELESNPTFSRWFGRLIGEIDGLADAPPGYLDRMVKVKDELSTLLAFLDPDGVRFPSIHPGDSLRN